MVSLKSARFTMEPNYFRQISVQPEAGHSNTLLKLSELKEEQAVESTEVHKQDF
jgi:hypothetical protein